MKSTFVYDTSGLINNQLKSKNPIQIFNENLFLSSSFLVSNKTEESGRATINFSESYTLEAGYVSRKSNWDFILKSDLGYEYLIDSIAVLGDDNLSFSLFRLPSKKTGFSYTYSAQINSALFPSYKYKLDKNSRLIKFRYGGFFNPGDIQFAYGLSWRFWSQSLINVSMATLKIQSVPRYDKTILLSERSPYVRTWSVDYGFTFNCRISHQISKRIRWQNQTRVFLNSINKSTIRIDLQNQISYKLINWLSISSHTKVTYIPIMEDKIQLLQEIRLGFEWNL